MLFLNANSDKISFLLLDSAMAIYWQVPECSIFSDGCLREVMVDGAPLSLTAETAAAADLGNFDVE